MISYTSIRTPGWDEEIGDQLQPSNHPESLEERKQRFRRDETCIRRLPQRSKSPYSQKMHEIIPLHARKERPTFKGTQPPKTQCPRRQNHQKPQHNNSNKHRVTLRELPGRLPRLGLERI